jgi:peptide deformylase
LKLALYPDPVLTRPAQTILEITDEVRQKAEAMVPFMGLEGGIGLAAPQVSWGVRLLLASEDGSPDATQVLVNPEVIWKGGGQVRDEEGCLSFPGIFGDVMRARRVRVKALNLEGTEVLVEAEDLFARVLQHEIDHLAGILFISKMGPADKIAIRPKLEELIRRFEAEGVRVEPGR